jgi:hypothetical protein
MKRTRRTIDVALKAKIGLETLREHATIADRRKTIVDSDLLT